MHEAGGVHAVEGLQEGEHDACGGADGEAAVAGEYVFEGLAVEVLEREEGVAGVGVAAFDEGDDAGGGMQSFEEFAFAFEAGPGVGFLAEGGLQALDGDELAEGAVGVFVGGGVDVGKGAVGNAFDEAESAGDGAFVEEVGVDEGGGVVGAAFAEDDDSAEAADGAAAGGGGVFAVEVHGHGGPCLGGSGRLPRASCGP